MGKKVFWVTVVVFSFIFIGIFINKIMTDKKIYKQNLTLLTKELKPYVLRDIHVKLLAPGKLERHEVKVKEKEKDIIKDGAIYEYKFGAFKISIAKFNYGKPDPNIEILQNWLIGQLQKESRKNTLKYTVKKLDNGEWKIRVIEGDMKFKRLKYRVGFFAKLMTKGKAFYQFIITYVDSNENMKPFCEKIFNSIQVMDE